MSTRTFTAADLRPVDLFDDSVRVHFASPERPELGACVLQWKDGALRGGDEYWWDGYPPVITASDKAKAKAAPPVFKGSFFEALQGD